MKMKTTWVVIADHQNVRVLRYDAAARTLFGLLKAPPAPTSESEPETEAGTLERGPKPTPIEAHLSRDHVRKLQSALHELRECRQLIDQALKDEAA